MTHSYPGYQNSIAADARTAAETVAAPVCFAQKQGNGVHSVCAMTRPEFVSATNARVLWGGYSEALKVVQVDMAAGFETAACIGGAICVERATCVKIAANNSIISVNDPHLSVR